MYYSINNFKVALNKTNKHIFVLHAHQFYLKLGGAYRDRTDDPLLAKQVLSQLSYSPLEIKLGGSGWT